MLTLHTSHERAIDLLNQHIESIKQLQQERNGDINFFAALEWTHSTAKLLGLVYSEVDPHTQDYIRIISGISTENPNWANLSINSSVAILRSYIKEIRLIIANPEFKEPLEKLEKTSSHERILHLFSKFHSIAKILENNRKNCSNFTILNEYDVQLLIHGLLTLQFEHIRIEEPMGSHAGGSSRMDFVLDDEHTIIEIKYASDGHLDDKIGEELLVDISRYGSDKKYSKLYCLIYDPNHKIRNAPILKKDLDSHTTEDFKIIVVIMPIR